MPLIYRTDPDLRVAIMSACPEIQRVKTGAYPNRFELASTDETGNAWVYHEVLDLRVVDKWWPLAAKVSAEVGIPMSWILACIYTESRGNPKAEASDGGWGLMQITHESLKAGLTREQVFDPEVNIGIGARVLHKHARVAGMDHLPKIASGYNAGAQSYGVPWPSTVSPWGFRETKGHIARFIAAHNAAVSAIKAKAEENAS